MAALVDEGPAGAGLTVAAPADLPDAAEWDGLVSMGQAPLRHGLVRAWQHVELPRFASMPLVVREDGRVVAAAHGYTYDFDLVTADSRVATAKLAFVRRLFPRALMSRVFEIGSPTPLVNPILAAPDASDAAIETLLAAAVEQGETLGASLTIVQNFELALRSSVSGMLRRLGFDAVPIPPTVILPLPYTTFDEYLDSMRAQYRRRARKVLDLSSHLECVELRTFADLAPALERMWRLVYDRASDVKREVITEAFFRAASADPRTVVLALRRADGSLASYAFLVEDAPWLHFLYTGFQRAAAEDEGAYFRLLYEIARHAIEHGFASVNLGMTTLEPKLDLGGFPLPLTAWIRHRHRRLQPIFVRLAHGPFAPELQPMRNVFKGSG